MEWRFDPAFVAYLDAVSEMERRVEGIVEGKADEMVWFLQHPASYTAGTSARSSDLLMPDRFPVYQTGRGGQYTYHGPGQVIAYVMIDLKCRSRDVRQFVYALEEWLILTLDALGVHGERRVGRVGIWIDQGGIEKKIAALGIRLKKWVSYHGISLNVNPVLDHFQGIIPCGLSQYGVTSLEDLGIKVGVEDVCNVLQEQWKKVLFLS